MDQKNNFKLLHDEIEYNNQAPKLVEEKVSSSLNFLSFFGTTIELFVPRIVDLLIVLMGGSSKTLQENNDSLIESEQNSADEKIDG